MATIAGALRRRVWIDQVHFQWVPNFYIIFVAEPGIVSKSTTINIGAQLLWEVPGVHKGPNSMTWQALVTKMAKCCESILLPNGDYLPMSAVTCAVSELGVFLNPHDRDMVDVLVDLWDGRAGTFEKETKTQGNDIIQNPWINIIACTTPGWISDNLPEYIIQGGFASRCVFVYASEKRRLIAYPREHNVHAEYMQQREDLVSDLETIAGLVGEYVLDREAIAHGTAWYEHIYKNKPAHLNNEKFKGYLARKQTHVHKLAMVLAAAERDNLVITKQNLEFSISMMEALEQEMPLVYANLGTTNTGRQVRSVLAALGQHGAVSVQDMYGRLHRTMSYMEFEQALNSAVMGGYARKLSQGQDLVIMPTGKQWDGV